MSDSEKIKINKSIDWLTYSTDISPNDHFTRIGVYDYVTLDNAFYYKRYADGQGITFDVSESENQGNKVVISGQGMKSLRRQGMTDFDIILAVSKEARNITRLDYAIDFIEGNHDPDELIELAKKGLVAGMKGKRIDIHARVDKPNFDYTGSIGSRTSDRYYRFYRKAIEQKIQDLNWTRLEMEIKKMRARVFSDESVKKGNIESVGDSMFLDGFDARGKLPWFDMAFIEGVDLEKIDMPERQTDYELYLMQVYASIKKNWMRAENVHAIQTFMEKLEALMDHKTALHIENAIVDMYNRSQEQSANERIE